MNSVKNLKYIIVCLVAAMAFITGGNAAAQHEGGLGEKKIHLNIADVDKLLLIEGMTEDLAYAIIDYREEKGFFKKPEDLLKVPGMTKDLYKTLDPKVGSEGDLYCIPREDAEFDEDDEPVLSPSKC